MNPPPSGDGPGRSRARQIHKKHRRRPALRVPAPLCHSRERVRGGWGPRRSRHCTGSPLPTLEADMGLSPNHNSPRAGGEGGWRWAGIPTLKVVSSAATDPRPPYWAQGTYLCRISGQRRGSPTQQHPSHARARLSTGPGPGLCSAQGITTCVLGSRAEQGAGPPASGRTGQGPGWPWPPEGPQGGAARV